MEITELKVNTAYDACGEIAVIKDILKSEHSGTVILFVRFIRNIGDSRPYDMLTIVPGKPDFGISRWIPATKESLLESVKRRMSYIQQREVDEILKVNI